ncbi:NrfD/PsrC family molybdoenzyme membrane anchor subunit [Desulfovibrio intestinalis]|uniref:Polysulfide reductase n=1 Tax=Desulfovibrio intestinalis TaxID=58621 RepID=A0A7W8FF16_9BACT|nr:NrfD/PsrC family molybdoenzyme membrane anchor subunit [Desulfovibrio intestinalis]MBB5142340.1 hypothetical protein [Desulfovibrio intestinalis]
METTKTMQKDTPQSACKAYSQDYSEDVIPHLPPWGVMTVIDVWLNNAALGLYIVTACALLLRPVTFGILAQPAFVLAWLLLVADLLMLVADLGDPRRFHHMLRTFRPTSPMWVGVWALTLSSVTILIPALWGALGLMNGFELLPPACAASIMAVLDSDAAVNILVTFIALGIICAAGGLCYKGVLFSATSRPVWRKTRWFSAYLTNGGILLGCALFIGLGMALHVTNGLHKLFPAMLVMLVIDMLLLQFHLRPAMRDGSSTLQRRNLGTATVLDAAAFACLLAVIAGVGNPALVALAVLAIAASALMGRHSFVLPTRGV